MTGSGETGTTDAATSYDRRLMASATIMMVDDEPLNMDVLQIHLESEGYDRFVTLTDSRLVLQALREKAPDVLLLDLFMPEVSGFEILDEMRRDDALRHIPVIVLTGSDDAETKLRALKSGATDFLAKPVDPSELALRMRNTLASRAWQKRVSHIDTLTDLPNRMFFMQILHRRAAREEGRSTTPAPTVLLLVNINRFKSVNDSLGPELADEVLRGFRDRLVAVLGGRARVSEDQLFDARQAADRTLSCVARLGGDRFAVLLPIDTDVPDGDALIRLLQRFVETMEQPFPAGGQGVYISASVGVATVTADRDSVESIVNEAETAMRHAQRGTGTGFAFYSEHMDARARELLSLETGLRTAVDRGEIFVLYQPKVNVATNRITGAEALVRWQHPELGLISPVHFIPLAEDSGMIVSIGAWVLRESCMQTRAWHELGYTDLRIAVNVSIRQLHEPDFIDLIRDALEESGLPASSLIIELTENMIMENAESNVNKLGMLKALGVKLSIDDFGTGYSSLSYLQRFPLDQLKIDQSFVAEIEGPESHAPIVKAVVSLAHDLGLSVVAEGIETRHQLAHIRAYGCEEYQGYLCSRPVAPDDFIALLTAGQQRTA